MQCNKGLIGGLLSGILLYNESITESMVRKVDILLTINDFLDKTDEKHKNMLLLAIVSLNDAKVPRVVYERDLLAEISVTSENDIEEYEEIKLSVLTELNKFLRISRTVLLPILWETPNICRVEVWSYD